ncbi:MAG: class I adenylate-forming enzyme family protein [Planctomycetota bacterium]
MRIGHWLARSARHHGQHEAVRDDDGACTYAELAARVGSLAAGLARAGTQRGDRVAVVAKNRREFVELYFAAAEVSAVLVPLNWRLRPDELRALIEDATARVVIAESEFATALGDCGEQRFVLGAAVASWKPFEELCVRASHGHDPFGDDGEVAVQMYTSGTTGRAKGALLTHRNIVAMTHSWLLEMPLAPRTDHFLQVTPLFHVGALLMTMSCVASGTPLRLLREFVPGAAVEALEQERITHALFVPSMIQWILSERAIETRRFDALRMIVYGAAPMPPDLLARAITIFGCAFLQGYGLTETAGVLTTLRPEDHRDDDPVRLRARLTSAGRAVSCCELRVVDATGREVQPGEVGEIVARGDNVTPGYWKNEPGTREALRDGWFHTGDLATCDADGYLTIVDRLKDMILVGGENVYPREIEDVLRTHPAVQDAAVIGIPHDVWGEEVLALVVARATVDERTLVRHCRDRLARFKCPTKVEFRAEVPRNAAGKALKKELRDPYWAQRARRV